MRQLLLHSGGMVGGSSVSWETTEWQGGHGVVYVRTFNKVSGDAQLNINASLIEGQAQLPGFPMAITESGIYPFWAPKGTKISGGLDVYPDGQLLFNTIALYGDA